MELAHASGTACAPRWNVASRSCDIRDPFNDTNNTASMSRRIRFALSALLAAPATAIAFEAVDTIPWPSSPPLPPMSSASSQAASASSNFPAYPKDAARPTTVWTEIGLMHDDNPFRVSDAANARAVVGSASKSDTVMRYGGGIRYEQRIVGRQNLFLEARGDYYDYSRFDQLDHFAYNLNGEWRWQLGNELSGALGVGRLQRVADPAEVLRPVRETIIANRAYANGAYQFAPEWRVRAAIEGDNATRERPALDDLNTNTRTVRVGVDYFTVLGNSIGVEARTSDGDAPVNNLVDPTGALVGNQYKEKEVAAVATYGATAQIRFGGRVGRTERTYSELTDRDFSGTTWRANVEWLPGNKTILGFETYKAPQSIIDVAAAHVVVRGTAFTASWAPTVKWVVSGRIFEEQREGVGTPESVALGTPVRDDTVHGVRLGVGWEPVRFAQVGVGYQYTKRTSNEVLREYDDRIASINLMIRF